MVYPCIYAAKEVFFKVHHPLPHRVAQPLGYLGNGLSYFIQFYTPQKQLKYNNIISIFLIVTSLITRASRLR